MKNKLVIVAAFAFLSSGCASIISDNTYPVAIRSTPSQLDFTVTDQKGLQIHSGQTPSTVILKSGAGYFSSAKYNVTFNNGNSEPRTFELKSGLDGWYFGNILLGGLIGMLIVDPATGAMWKLPESQDFYLEGNEKLNKSVNLNSGRSLRITSINDIPASERLNLERLQ